MENEGKRKKILLVTRPIGPPWDEASKNFTFSLAMNVKDFDLTLLTFDRMENLPANIKQEQIYSEAGFGFSQKLRLINFLRRFSQNYDILHFLFTPTKLNSWIIKKIIRNKNIKTVQTVATLREDRYSDKDLGDIIFADKVVTFSRYAQKKLQALGMNNVSQIYPGINLDQYAPAAKCLVLIKELNIKEDDFVVTFPGEFTRLGVIDDLVKMVIDKSKYMRNKNVKFIFACRVKNKKDFIKKEKIREELSKRKISDIVMLPDTFQSMEAVFNTSDVVLFSVGDMNGKFDVPLAAIEAMACEKPVIVSDVAILSEFANEENSVRIKAGDTEAIWTAIINLFNSIELRNQIGKTARIYVVQNFSIRQSAEKYEKIYQAMSYGSQN